MWFPDLPSQAKVVHYLTRQGYRFQLADGNCVLVDAEWDRLRTAPKPAGDLPPVVADVIDTVNENVAKLNSRLFTYQDYAAIGRRR